jgi:hypothetical protein
VIEYPPYVIVVNDMGVDAADSKLGAAALFEALTNRRRLLAPVLLAISDKNVRVQYDFLGHWFSLNHNVENTYCYI